MPSTKSIKQRIRSVKNTSQITKAMEVVSATKMRKSQAFALAARPYATASLALLQNLLLRTPAGLIPPLLTPRPVKHRVFNIITSDKGLAGAFNANVLKKAEVLIAEMKASGMPYTLITVGKKAKEYFERRGESILHAYAGYGDYTTTEQTREIADMLIAGFLDGSWDEAHAIYTNFRTTLSQETKIAKILPATPDGIADAVHAILPERGRYAESSSSTAYNLQPTTSYQYEYLFEPSPAEILASLVPQLIRIHVHQIILESNASEHSARMVAMKNASDNARELMSALGLAYNKARQAGITRELIEVTAGSEAMNI